MNALNFIQKAILSILLIGVFIPHFAFAEETTPSLFAMGGGYMQTRNYNSGLLQLEYKYGHYLWHYLRPQATLLFSKFYSGYIGFGLGWEWHVTKQIVIIPSFSPGIYWKGRGRDLGSPLEFRSALELSYEMKNQVRVGFQMAHVSNAHLTHRNPGFNTFLLSVSFPLNKR